MTKKRVHEIAKEQGLSSKELLECYRRAEPHWERRHEVRARSTATVKRGVGLASQIWFGGGGPPTTLRQFAEVTLRGARRA